MFLQNIRWISFRFDGDRVTPDSLKMRVLLDSMYNLAKPFQALILDSKSCSGYGKVYLKCSKLNLANLKEIYKMSNMFDSEFCNVVYIEKDNVVLLTWKKFCCFDNYRRPTMFASGLLRQYNGSNFVIDARNGFEDEKEDVEWGFRVLLPDMAQSNCKKCIFIMQELPSII